MSITAVLIWGADIIRLTMSPDLPADAFTAALRMPKSTWRVSGVLLTKSANPCRLGAEPSPPLIAVCLMADVSPCRAD